MAENWMSLRAYARHRGVRLAAVQKAIESGRVTAVRRRKENGRLQAIECTAADLQWAMNTDPVEAGKSGKVIVPPTMPGAVAESLTASDDDPDDALESPAGSKAPEGDKDPGGFYEGRARRMQVQAEEAELDLLERKGLLVSATAVENALMDMFRQTRDQLQNISARLAPRLAAETDPTRIDQLMNDEIALVLNELSRDAERFAAEGTA